jgi:hypothetical protein
MDDHPMIGQTLRRLFGVALLLAAAGSAQAQYYPPVSCGSHQWINQAGFGTGFNCHQPFFVDLGGSLNYSQATVAGMLRYTLTGANFNSTADQAITITLPTGTTNYRLNAIFFSNPSTSLTTAVGGVYTGAGKTGVAVVAASQAYSALATNSPGASGSMLNATITNGASAMYNATTLYLSLTTAQGAAATADVTVDIQPLN